MKNQEDIRKKPSVENLSNDGEKERPEWIKRKSI